MLKIPSMPGRVLAGSPPTRVLIAENDSRTAETMRIVLERESFEVTICRESERALDLSRTLPADLLIVDHDLPGLGGVELCRQLRTFSDAYVIMLSNRDSRTDRVVSLSVGADDSVVKPIDTGELVARIRAMQRRPRTVAGKPTVYGHGDLEVDSGARTVTVADERVGLSRTEFDLLEALISNPRISLSRRQLLELVWGDSWHGDDHVIDVHISNLRRKLGKRSYIETVRGFGYRIGD